MHTNAYKTVSSDQLDQDRANPALSQPWTVQCCSNQGFPVTNTGCQSLSRSEEDRSFKPGIL